MNNLSFAIQPSLRNEYEIMNELFSLLESVDPVMAEDIRMEYLDVLGEDVDEDDAWGLEDAVSFAIDALFDAINDSPEVLKSDYSLDWGDDWLSFVNSEGESYGYSN